MAKKKKAAKSTGVNVNKPPIEMLWKRIKELEWWEGSGFNRRMQASDLFVSLEKVG